MFLKEMPIKNHRQYLSVIFMYANNHVSNQSPLYRGLGNVAKAEELYLAEMEEWSCQFSADGFAALPEPTTSQAMRYNSLSLLDELNSLDQVALA